MFEIFLSLYENISKIEKMFIIKLLKEEDIMYGKKISLSCFYGYHHYKEDIALFAEMGFKFIVCLLHGQVFSQMGMNKT